MEYNLTHWLFSETVFSEFCSVRLLKEPLQFLVIRLNSSTPAGAGVRLHDWRGPQGLGQGLHASAPGAGGCAAQVPATAPPRYSPHQSRRERPTRDPLLQQNDETRGETDDVWCTKQS